jgi:hypothetical protein
MTKLTQCANDFNKYYNKYNYPHITPKPKPNIIYTDVIYDFVQKILKIFLTIFMIVLIVFKCYIISSIIIKATHDKEWFTAFLLSAEMLISGILRMLKRRRA